MDVKYSVTYKIAPPGAKYIYQEDNHNKGYKAGDVVSSVAGHMWFVASDGNGKDTSAGLESINSKMFDEGNISEHDDRAYQKTSYEIKIALTETQYNNLLTFIDKPQSFGFDHKKYRALNNSCVDFAYHSLMAIGYNRNRYEGETLPDNNGVILKAILKSEGAPIIRDDLIRRGNTYIKRPVSRLTPDYFKPVDNGAPIPVPAGSQLGISINNTPLPARQVPDENKAQHDVFSGFIQNWPTHRIFAVDNLLTNTDFASTQMAGMASGGIRPGAVQADPNPRPNRYLSDFYHPGSTFSHERLRNAVTVNGLSAMTTHNTYVDPLLLDLTGNGAGMTDIRDGVLFDTTNSGTLKRTGWADRKTGMLVVDEGRGHIKNISQMFSEYYGGQTGTAGAEGNRPFRDGFAALASEDRNGDGRVDARDPIWRRLRVWIDRNHDGQSDAGELRTLSSLGITRFNLAHQKRDDIRDGNRVTGSGSFIIRGRTREMLSVTFLGDPVSNTLRPEGAGTRVVSTSDGRKTTAWVSHSTRGETLNADMLKVSNLYGGSGDDTLIAGSAGGWLIGGGGNNTYTGSAANDVFVISASDDPSRIRGNGGRDTAIIVGKGGVTLNMAKAGLTIAQGGEGNDVIVSGGENGVFIRGGGGNSLLIGGQGNDVLVGGHGRNTIFGGDGKSVIYAGPQGDNIHASSGGSIIHAGGGMDRIFGGDSDDVVEVGHGNATIDGGGGVNLVMLHGNYGEYRITRTNSGYQVKDLVRGRDGTVTLKNIQKLSFADISAVDLRLPNAMPVPDVLTHDRYGRPFSRTQARQIQTSTLLANDQRLSSEGELRISEAGEATGGTVRLTAGGDILFTPVAGYTGMMSFKYSVTDAGGNASASVVDLNSGKSAPMRAIVTLMTPDMPSDPLVARQWYLNETGILPVWQDFTGRGVRIGLFEPGGEFATVPETFDVSHPDLAPNIDQAWLQTQRKQGSLPSQVSGHATMVAGVMVAARNKIGGVGVAHGASLGGYYLANSGADLSGLGQMVSVDVANNNWGFTQDFGLSNYPDSAVSMGTALFMNAHYAASNGRGGLGTVMVVAGGNQRAAGGSAQGSLTGNNRFSVQVGAVNARGDLSTLQTAAAPFSNPGASLLVSAPGSQIVSTSHKVETDRGSTFGHDYAAMQGTSFATPIVSGIVALMLEARPDLGYRDVQQILALSARKIDDPSTRWRDNGGHHWNNGGMHASHDYGFGHVDARAAVRLAESWLTQNTAASEHVLSATGGHGGKTLSAGASLSSSVTMAGGLNVEHIEVDFDAEVGRLGDVTLSLVSPGGTESILLGRQGKVPDGMAGAGPDDRGSLRSGRFRYSFMSTHALGEHSAGNWTLKLRDAASGLPVTLNNWALRLYGSRRTANDTYFYTDEYGSSVGRNPGRAVLDDTVNGTAGGRNTFSAAAVSQDVRLNLLTGRGVIGAAALTVKKPAEIHNLISGDGNDTLVAGNSGALIDGGRGINTLTGGSGRDFFVVHRREGGRDTITNFEAGQRDRIALTGFSGRTFADLQLTQQGRDVRVSLGNNQRIILGGQTVSRISASDFLFQSTLMVPEAYVNSSASSRAPDEVSGAIIMAGGSQGIRFSTDGQGRMIAGLAGVVYSRESATPGTFVVAGQQGVTDYRNALRGFRQGRDKIDLRQTGVRNFSQLRIEKVSRGVVNGLAMVHGVNISLGDAAGRAVNLLYIDAMDVAQLSAKDFIFAEAAPVRGPLTEPVNVSAPVLVTPAVAVPSDISYSPPAEPAAVSETAVTASQPRPPAKILPSDPVEKTKEIVPVSLSKRREQLTVGNESKTVNMQGERTQLVAGDGDMTVNASGLRADIRLKNGNNSVVSDALFANITAGNGQNTIVSNKSHAEIKTGDGNNIITSAGDFAKIKTGDGNNIITSAGGFAKINTGNGNNTIQVNGSSTQLNTGDGNNTIQINDSSTQLKTGDGNNTITSTGSFAKINAGNGNNIITSTGSFAKINTGNGNNRILSEESFAEITTGNGDNTVTASGSSARIRVGSGINRLNFKSIWGELTFGKDIRYERLRFRPVEQDLQISVTGSRQSVILQDWYTPGPSRPSTIIAGNNHKLMAQNVENLVQAMAAFAPVDSASIVFNEAEMQRLQPVLAANWQ